MHFSMTLLLAALGSLASATGTNAAQVQEVNTEESLAFKGRLADLFPPPFVSDDDVKIKARDLRSASPSEVMETISLMAKKKCDSSSQCAPPCNGMGPWLGRPSFAACAFCISVYTITGNGNAC